MISVATKGHAAQHNGGTSLTAGRDVDKRYSPTCIQRWLPTLFSQALWQTYLHTVTTEKNCLAYSDHLISAMENSSCQPLWGITLELIPRLYIQRIFLRYTRQVASTHVLKWHHYQISSPTPFPHKQPKSLTLWRLTTPIGVAPQR